MSNLTAQQIYEITRGKDSREKVEKRNISKITHPLAYGGNALSGVKNKFSKEYKEKGLAMRRARLKREALEKKKK